MWPAANRSLPVVASSRPAQKPRASSVLIEKYGQHQPLNRQAVRYAWEGVELDLSMLADQVGGCVMLLRPLYDLLPPMCSLPSA